MIGNVINTAPYYAGSSTILIDAFLVGINAFNAFVLFTYLHPVESPFKKILMNAKHHIVSKVHATPFHVSAVLSALLFISTYSAIKYHVSSPKDQAMLIRAIVSAYTFACTRIFVKLSDTMIKLSVDRILEVEKDSARHDIVNFVPPSKSIANALVAPHNLLFPVDSTGMERIPDGVPHLFVSNHSLYGMEMPLFVNELYQTKGIFPRGLADHIQFAAPHGPLLRAAGAVDGTRDNVDSLMEAGYDVLVYPGGGHEVMKSSSVPNYELLWKERVGFARCAIKHGYPILPCACVGTEDMLRRVGDIPTGYKGMVVPISVTNPCKVQKIYFWFGRPISTKQYRGEFSNDDFAREVRDKTKAAIEAGICELQEKQRVDPERYLVYRCASKIHQCFLPSTKKEEAISQSSSLDGKQTVGGENEEGDKFKMK